MSLASILILLGGLAVAAFLYFKRRTLTGANSRGWIIGPIIHGDNHSLKMPARPTMQGKGWTMKFPGPGGKVDYVQNFDPPTLVGATAIVMRFAVKGGGFVPFEGTAKSKATVTVQIQRKGDDWTGEGKMRLYRYYSRTRTVLAAGEYEITYPLDVAHWGGVNSGPDDPEAFAACLRELDNIAVVFGGGSGAGHGVWATAPSQFTLLEMEVR